MNWPSWLVGGVDISAEQQRSNELDAQLAALNQKALADGTYNQSTFDQAEFNRQRGQVADVNAEVSTAFGQGIQDGANNIRGAVGSAVSFPFKLIPWQLWAVGAVALFFYMGGGLWLKGILKKK